MSHVDLHMHSTYSDGSDHVEELYHNVIKVGIDIFALTDHDTIAGIAPMQKQIKAPVRFIPGIEFSAITKYREAHILGYDYDPSNQTFLAAIDEGVQKRRAKLDHRLDYLKEQFDIAFAPADLAYLYSLNAAAKPHLARMLMKYGYCSTISEGIEKYIKGCPGDHDRLDYRTAIKAIRAAGGIAIWAHPLGGEHMRHFEKWEFERQLDLLLQAGIQGLECYYSRYNEKEIAMLVEACHKHHLLISGGSDYHGENKNIALGTLNNYGQDVSVNQLTLLNTILHKNTK